MDTSLNTRGLPILRVSVWYRGTRVPYLSKGAERDIIQEV